MHHLFAKHWTFSRSTLILIVVACFTGPSLVVAEDMIPSSFAQYATSPDLSPDETYTVELLIERARSRFDPGSWEKGMERGDAREAPDYQPAFSTDHIQQSAKELSGLSWLSFQRMRKRERPIRDLNAIRYLPELTDLILKGNEVYDLTPLRSSKNLIRLDLHGNPIRDISPLTGCASLEELALDEAPIGDFSVLQSLPRLRELSISADQLPEFRAVECLPVLRRLEISGAFDSFEGFPEMPELRAIYGAKVASLNGLEEFSKIENLISFNGEIKSLEPLRELKNLTHANFWKCRVRSLKPIAGLPFLRDFSLSSDVILFDLSPLKSLPLLHRVSVKSWGRNPDSVKKINSSLSSWDIEFRAESPRYIPSLELEVVTEKVFDHYDTKVRYNTPKNETNEEMLGSELDWLDEQLNKLFAENFEEDEDYSVPYLSPRSRSRTVMLYSEKAINAFPEIVIGMQKILSYSKEDWILYFQSDVSGPDFIVWVYPDKIMVTEEYADIVRKLIEEK
ncbi:hypothetical protein N9059_00605 [bacterium]|nr:hypothetical protein [bacterium]